MAFLHLRQANHQILTNLSSYFLAKTTQERIAFRTMIDCSNRFVSIELSRRRMAQEAGTTLRSVDRWKSEWKENGLVESQSRRTHLKNRSLTNRYAFHPSLYDSQIRASLSTIPEFSLVFKMTPVPREIVKPLYGRKTHNIRVLLSENKVDNENYVSPIKSPSLFGIKQLNQSAEFEASQTLQLEKPPSSSILPGYRYEMTPQEKIAYVLARSEHEAKKKKEPINQKSMPSGLSSYEQGQWIKANLLRSKDIEDQSASRERLEAKAKYEREFVDWIEKERRKENWKRNRIYN